MDKTKQNKTKIIKILLLSSALCSTQAWAMDPGPADAAAPLSPRSQQAQIYYEQWQNIVEKYPSAFLSGDAQRALQRDPTQGPAIARAFIRLFPKIVEKYPTYLYDYARDAFHGDPTQGPAIARALIRLFPKIVEKDPTYLLYDSAQSALQRDPTQGPAIARALIRFFPKIAEKDPTYLYDSAHTALQGDPTQGPAIASALIRLFPQTALQGDPTQGPEIASVLIRLFPQIVEKDPVAAQNALYFFCDISPQQKRAFYNQNQREIEYFLNWAPTSEHMDKMKRLYDELKRLYDIAQRHEEQAMATERLTKKYDGPFPAEVAGVVGEYIGGYNSSKHVSLQNIRDREAIARANAAALGQVHASRALGSERMLPSQTEEKLRRYYAEEAAFLAANPGGDFKAAFAAKYPDSATWLDYMIFKGHIR